MDADLSDDEAGDNVVDFIASRNAIVFCIDAADNMFQLDENGKSHLQLCFGTVKKRLLNNIFLSDKEFVGIVLMGASSKAASTPNGKSSVFFELSRSGADICRLLESYENKTGEDFKKDFMEDYDVLPSGSLSDSLWTCSSLLSLSNTKFGVKEIIIMTNNTMENIDANTKRQTLKRIEALAQVEISLMLMYIGENFNLDPFFKDLLVVAHPGSTVTGGTHWAASDLVNDPRTVLSRVSNNRHLAQMDFCVTPSTKITVKAYSLFRRQDHADFKRNIKLFKETNEQVSVSSNRYDKTTGEIVHADSLVYGVSTGAGPAYLKKEERAEMRDLYPTNITLLGFKPISEVFWGDHIRPGLLLQADDVERSGSSSLFYALHKVCIERNQTPLVRVCLRKGSAARLAHLLPQLENASECPFSNFNSFYLIYLPFLGECRDKEVASDPLTQDLTEIEEEAALMIKGASFKFHPSLFPNPKIAMQYNGVEALAMDYAEAKEVIDALDPDLDSIDDRIGEYAKNLMKMSQEAAADS